MAVVTTFGRPSSVMTSGPKFKYPFIQKVYKMSKEIKGMPIGYDPDYSSQTGGTPLLNSHINASSRVDDGEGTPENTVSIPSESEVITKDFNFVNVDFYIEYQIVDPIKAYINSQYAISILRTWPSPISGTRWAPTVWTR